jgi:uncharacterized protein YhbP (UPF0306 family)
MCLAAVHCSIQILLEPIFDSSFKPLIAIPQDLMRHLRVNQVQSQMGGNVTQRKRHARP